VVYPLKHCDELLRLSLRGKGLIFSITKEDTSWDSTHGTLREKKLLSGERNQNRASHWVGTDWEGLKDLLGNRNGCKCTMHACLVF
jgi:hypothetical protein